MFSYRGKRIRELSTRIWFAALARAEIKDFRWHDMRHTWASWHVQSGTPLFALQELGGWESIEMVRRYAHLAADHLAPYAERLSAFWAVSVPNSRHNYGTAEKSRSLRISSKLLFVLVAWAGFEGPI